VFFDMLTISINRGLNQPVYEQIADQVRQLVSSGALAPGAALPSVRRLAGDFGVNLNTIARAYRLLEDEGFLTIRDRAGAMVAPPAREVDPNSRVVLLDQLRTTLARLRQAGIATGELVQLVQDEVLAMRGRTRETQE
jgi:DNA-binding transcriptional regulator YhcF (GntR family)